MVVSGSSLDLKVRVDRHYSGNVLLTDSTGSIFDFESSDIPFLLKRVGELQSALVSLSDLKVWVIRLYFVRE